MSSGLKKLINDLSYGVDVALDDVNALADKYNLSSEEKQLLNSKDEDDLKQLGLKKKESQIVLSYNHSCLCGPHTLPTYLVSDGKEASKA
ncbi:MULTISPECIES: hypothetical protein [Lactobacillus]|uniref:Uncharacterized protein n=1 Tax=Lactobacillus xujianguonis TaxID=2495899 RepID=A0A437ST68_9LACO|nr:MULTISPECIES: hypothetical protein [Lactobacillus]RVU70042.1 hypothetical protein EJK17_09670 [Lactobacillus xujianguonis]RVU72405.1 hypothetical protein EJK20_10095 [Lactobacillus xujianguonis]